MKFFFNTPTPSNISLMWNFGSMLGLTMTFQVISGFFLSMNYCSNINFSFLNYILISKIINNGLILQLIHAHLSSVIFLVMYFHIMKSLLNKSFNNKSMWVSGNVMLIMVMASAFLGYVLPWGQMSFWGATVITNIMSSIPFLGLKITTWIWGNFCVDNSTLNRFFSLHFIIPLFILVLSVFHLIFLHKKGSSNQLGIYSNKDKIYFSQNFIFKDLISIFMLVFLYYYVFCFFIDHHFSMAKENFFPADPLNTPLHIKPEWYFMFAYALLRSIPSKVGGIISLLMLFLIFIFLMFNKSSYSKFYFMKKIYMFFFLMMFLSMTHLGYKMIEFPFVEMSLFYGIQMMFFLWIL